MVVNVFPSLQEFASMDELLRKMPMYQVCSSLLKNKPQNSLLVSSEKKFQLIALATPAVATSSSVSPVLSYETWK